METRKEWYIALTAMCKTQLNRLTTYWKYRHMFEKECEEIRQQLEEIDETRNNFYKCSILTKELLCDPRYEEMWQIMVDEARENHVKEAKMLENEKLIKKIALLLTLN